MSHAYGMAHDGYTLCGLSESNVTAGVQGGWDKKFEVWDAFIVGGSPDVISVTPDTPYKTLQDLIEAAKANPSSIKASASGAGSIHHLNLLAVENGSGAKFNFIPYKGSNDAQNAAMTGEVSVVVTSLAEQQQLLRGGKLRALCMLIPDAFEVQDLGAIPSAFNAYPGLSKYLPISQAIGFAVPADTPAEVKTVLVDAFNKARAVQFIKNAKRTLPSMSGPTRSPAALWVAVMNFPFNTTMKPAHTNTTSISTTMTANGTGTISVAPSTSSNMSNSSII